MTSDLAEPRRARPTTAWLILKRALVSGAVATATSSLALAAAARAEGKGAAQPLNATSHWLYGDQIARHRHAGVDPTIIGLGTHVSATIFWAAFYETSLVLRPARSSQEEFTRAGTIALLAAIVDYTVTPKRFTPGWELVLTKRAMSFAYAAMAAGFAVTSALRRGRR